MSYKVELVEKKDPLIQLEVSKSSIKNLLNDLLMKQKVSNNTKSCVKKYKGTEIEFSPVYFNSTTKAVINHKFDLHNINISTFPIYISGKNLKIQWIYCFCMMGINLMCR